MNQTKLIPLLNMVESLLINKMNINMRADTISLKLIKLQENNEEIEIIFEGVSAFYYIDENKQIHYDWDIKSTNLNSITYYSDGIGEFQAIEVINGVEVEPFAVSHPNFVLEMMDKSLFIEAQSVKINNKKFKTGYPMN